MNHLRAGRGAGFLAIVTAGVLTLAACAAPQGEATPTPGNTGDAGGTQELQPFIAAASGISAPYGALLAGIQEGIFEEEGLAVETNTLANPPAAVAAAQSGEVDAVFVPSVVALNAMAGGVELMFIAPGDGYVDGASRSADPSVYDDSGVYASAASGITELTQLPGRTVAVPARNALFEVAISDGLAQAGLDPASVNWVTLDFASAVSALEAGTVDAASVFAPYTTEAEKVGAVRIASPSVELFEEGVSGVWVAGAAQVTAKPDAFAAFARGVQRANDFSNKNPEVPIQAYIDFSGTQLTVDEVNVPYWPTEIRRKDLDRINGKLVSLGFLAAPVDLDGKILEG